MRKTLSITLLMAIAGLAAVQAQSGTVSIRGTVKNFNPGDEISVIKRDGFDKKILSTGQINEDGTYSLSVTSDKPGLVTISCARYQNVSAWLEDEDLQVDFRGRDTARIRLMIPEFIKINGGKKNDIINQQNFINIRDYSNMIGIYKNLYPIEELSKEKKDSLIRNFNNLNKENTLEQLRYIVKNNQSTTSVVALLPSLDAKEDSLLIEQTLDAIKDANPGTTIAQDYRAARAETDARIKASSVGEIAPDLKFKDKNGKEVSISSFKGKVLIVDFWASWCGPCKAEIPKLKAIYNDFKNNKKVAFLSISIDEKRENWLKALDNEKMEWTQLLAPNSGKEALEKYQFKGIPFIIAIGADGHIFRKNLRGEAVREAINDALSQKK